LLYWLNGMQSPVPVDLPWLPGWVTTVLMTIYLVWLVNLYNFMDGIDGIAGAEAVTVTVAAAGLYGLVGIPAPAGMVPGLLAAAAAGFLVWNFPRARIFMGDAGSGFLGLMLGACSVLAALQAPALFWAWQILLGVFLVDATVTLLRRVLRGERFYEAHRSHAYQHAARRVGSHRPVTRAVVAIDVVWLLPMAALVATGRLEPLYGIAIAYAPLIALALYYNAGRQEE
jgi:Fuc2NAc and GlcNAc transferase